MKNGLKINELQRQLTTLRNILSEYETETNRLKNNTYVSHYYNNDPEFYKNVREHIVYVHIKDAVALPRPDGVRPEAKFTYAGDGAGDVRAIVTDLRETGYDGGFSMEPHLAVVFHDENGAVSEDSVRYSNYVEYGRRFEKLLTDCGWTL